jgi:hypothetical protein
MKTVVKFFVVLLVSAFAIGVAAWLLAPLSHSTSKISANVDEVWASETGAAVAPVKTTPRQAAIDSAQVYVDMGQFSRTKLISQLSSGYVENYTKADGEYAADHIDVDYFQEAFQSAELYMEVEQKFTRNSMIKQLTTAEQFTKAQAIYAADKVGLK